VVINAEAEEKIIDFSLSLSNESIKAQELKDLSPQRVEPADVQNQGFSELPLIRQENSQEVKQQVYSQEIFALKKNFQMSSFLSSLMNWQAMGTHSVFSKNYRIPENIGLIHFNKEGVTSLNIFNEKEKVDYLVDASHLKTEALQEKRLFDLEVLGSSQGGFKISPRLVTSKETSLSQTSFMSVQMMHDFVDRKSTRL